MTKHIHRYIIGNSPKLPSHEIIPSDTATVEYAKVTNELLQEEPIVIIITDLSLTPMQLSKIEYAVLNPA